MNPDSLETPGDPVSMLQPSCSSAELELAFEAGDELPVTLPAVRDNPPDIMPGPSVPALRAAEGPRIAAGDLFAALLAEAGKPATRRARDQGIRDFATYLASSGALPAPNPAAACALLVSMGRGSANGVADGYRRHLLDRQLAPSTINQRLCTLSRVVWLGNKYDLIGWSLIVEPLAVQALRDTAGPGRSGWVRFYAQARREAQESELGTRNLAIVCLAYFCALRREEIASLDLEDWNPDTGKLQITRKHQHQKTFAADPNAEATAAIERWIDVRGHEPGPLFHRMDHAGTGRTARAMGIRETDTRLTSDAIWHLVRAIGQRAGLRTPVRPHGLRHQAITEGARRGADVLKLQQFGGHKDPKTTLTYINNLGDTASEVGRLLSESDPAL